MKPARQSAVRPRRRFKPQAWAGAPLYERLLRESKLVVDTRDALRSVPGDKSKVVRL